jgi:uncharacterized DUF497 family protein
VTYEWDAFKAIANLKKHGIRFADAVGVFDDSLALTMPDGRFEEDRFVSVGTDSMRRVLVVSYTWRGDAIRLISARKALPKERRQYEG